VCLSDLVSVPQVSGTSVPVPLPTITGINSPVVINAGGRRQLAWWEILLMVLGCVLIFLCILALFRRRMRAKRAKRTAAFAAAKNIDARGVSWRAKFFSLFSRQPRIPKEEKAALRLERLRNLEVERHMAALGKLGGTEMGSGAPSSSQYARSRRLSATGSDAESFYSQVTGQPPRAPAPRQPVSFRGVARAAGSSRHSGMTISSARRRSLSDAEQYAKSVVEGREAVATLGRGRDGGGGEGGGQHPVGPAGTGPGQESRNPFRK
jgi:hypothetical protein